MAEPFASESLPGMLADNMAELVTRLRLSSTLPGFSRNPPACLPRLVVMARILEGLDAIAPGVARLGQTINSLADLLVEFPAAAEPTLNPSLQRLAEFLESFLQGLDKGENLETWLHHPRWLALQRSFSNSHTSLAVFDAMDDIIRQHKQQQDGVLLSTSSPEAMARRWAEVCRQGDLVFGATGRGSLSGLRVILLLDSEISRHFLREKLAGGGAEVIIAASAASVLETSRDFEVSPTILCDQVAPTNHLSELRRLVEQTSALGTIPLILVTMGDGSGLYSNVERARNLGARGVWRDPYELADLLPCILQPKPEN